MKIRSDFRLPTAQRGAVLYVAIMLLLLASVLTVAALNVGLFEQKSTGNDVRSKAVNEIAEAGLAQGFEYLMRQHPAMMEDTTTWVKCGATETAFPCGAISTDAIDTDGDPSTTATVARRATMYHLVNSGYTNSNFDNAMVGRMLPLTSEIATAANGSQVAYGVAPVLCYVAARATGESATAPIRCADSPSTATNRRIVTFVSVARMPDEAARTTLTQTMGTYALLSNPAGHPPVIASGSIDITGTLQIVTNPNAGGAGVPVSVWTRKDVSKTGTPNTCYADEFYRFGAKNNDPPTLEDGVVICDTCQCNGDKSLSYDKSGNVQSEGIDILDVEGDSSTARSGQQGINYNVKSDSLSYPTCEFPPDLFANVFGVSAWEDDDDDCFAEKKIMTSFTNPNNGVQVTMGADEAYLYTNAQYIINATTAGAVYRKPDQVTTATYPSASLSGLIWCQSNCDVGSNQQLGSPAAPVALVIDGSARIQGRVFGLIFLRTTSGTGVTITPSSGYTMTTAQIAAGGSATLDMNGHAAVYGSVIVQGQVDKANGTAAVIYDQTVLQNLGNNPNNTRYATLPGAWNDNYSY
jgi:Tfp pilus assembly protein PilX